MCEQSEYESQEMRFHSHHSYGRRETHHLESSGIIWNQPDDEFPFARMYDVASIAETDAPHCADGVNKTVKNKFPCIRIR